jgi:galactokinase
MIDADALRRSFHELYGTRSRLWSAPGRVNLLGEHTDYNEGFVLPMAIDRQTVVAGAARDDRRVRVRSLNMDESAEFDLDEAGRSRRGVWLDYVEGVARVLEARSIRLSGSDLVIASDVPAGAGLSSSAALEISVGLALVALSGAEIDPTALALAGQAAEHEYVGTRCGIMDQFTVAHARRGCALLLDCRSLEAELIPLRLPEVSVVVCDTNVRHELASSEYNRRREECERAVDLLREVLPGIRSLRDVSVADFQTHEPRLPANIRRRCRHVVTENARTLACARALSAGDGAEAGRLMWLSHASLRDDYEVSSVELDLLVSIAAQSSGVLGARMTGGGFGGCTVNLVRRDALADFQDSIASRYRQTTGFDPTIYVVEAADGAREIGTGERGVGDAPALDSGVAH